MLSKRFSLLAVLFFLAISIVPVSLNAATCPIKRQQISLKTWDGYKIDVDIYAPKTGDNLPLVVFSPSWGLFKIEYEIPAIKMAAKGYVAVTYTARGWFNSTGTINVGEENDMRDLKTIFDYAIANYPVDVNNIGMAGISMGSIRSLTYSLYDHRIKAIAALSCAPDMIEALYKQHTANMSWNATNDQSSSLSDAVDALALGNNVASLLDWLEGLSAQTYINDYATERPDLKVYISNAYDDQLMDPNSIIDFFEQLDVSEKVLDLNNGTHAFPVGYGCAGLPERTWTKVYKWFDYQLKGISSNIVDRIENHPVGLQVKGTGDRLYFSSWPADKIFYNNYYLNPRKSSLRGSLGTCKNDKRAVDVINSGKGSAAKILASDNILAQMINPDVVTNINLLLRYYAMVWMSGYAGHDRMIAGIPVMNLSVVPSKADAQVIAHLYDVDLLGYGTLLTHSAWTLRNITPGARQKLSFSFHAIAAKLKKYHRLAVVIDTYDKTCGFPANKPAYTVSFKYDDAPVLKMPFTNVKPIYEPLM